MVLRHPEYRAWQMQAQHLQAAPGEEVRVVAPGTSVLRACGVPVVGGLARWPEAIDLEAHVGWVQHEQLLFEPSQVYLTTRRYMSNGPRPTLSWRAPGGADAWRIWLVAAATPTFVDAPAEMRVQIDTAGFLRIDGAVTTDGYVVNTAYSVHRPHPADAIANELVPAQRLPTIGDRMSDAGVTWAWFAGGWNDAAAGHPDPTFQFHHQPFVYFARFADGSPARADHLLDESDFLRRATEGTLPAVSFVKPLGTVNEHPGYSDIANAERHVVSLIDAVRNGPNWKDAVIIVTYDENGGFWDDVPPPDGDRWGPGTRVPTIVVSPFAKRHFVDNTTYDTTSILALIEHRFGLRSLGPRDASARDLRADFSFK